MSSFVCNASGRREQFSDVQGQIALEVNRSHKRPVVTFSIQITARLDEEEAVFWLKEAGPVNVDRLAVEHDLVALGAGGFYCCGHMEIERLAFLAYRKTQQVWRFVGVAEVSGKQLEIDVDAAVVHTINWGCG